jgi:23S rRNA pseudouridine1911/1915/1917 synthase
MQPRPMVDRPVIVLHEDNHLLALNKPVALITQGASADQASLLALAKDYLKHKYHKPGNVYLGTVSRLDAAVSGVVLFARTSKAAARLSEQFRLRTAEKTYWALVAGNPRPADECVDWLVRDDRLARTRVVDSAADGAREARLSYRRLRRVGRGWMLEIRLETGRKHQIRAQLAARGLAIWGDRKYDSREPFGQGIALHARRLAIIHPTLGTPLSITAPMPEAWTRVGVVENEG